MSTALAQRLIEQRARTWEGMKATLDAADLEKRDLTVEEQTAYDQRNADLDKWDARIKDLIGNEKRAMEAEAALADILKRPVDERRDDPQASVSELRSFLKDGKTADGKKTFEVRSEKPFGTDELRTLSKLTAGAGANTVKISFYERLMAHLIEVSGILNAGPTLLNTTTGEQIQVPKTTAHSTGALFAEAATITPSDPTFGQVPLDAYKYAVLIQVSNELITDTSVDLEGYLAMQAGRAVGNAFGVHAITGTGTSQPNGVVTAATLGVTGAASVVGAFSSDNLIDLFFSVIAPYRNSPSCGWLLKDASLATARKLKDTTGQYLWQPSLQIGEPDTILGKKVNTDPNVAAVALSAKSVLFGDFSQYFVRQVNGIQFAQSEHFAFSSDLQTYRVTYRADGDLVDLTGAIKYFQGNAA
jgi:HK97 family phage major capsid protein